MKKKIEIASHGNTWVDTSAPIVCPECASLNVKEYTYNSSEWLGPFFIGYTEKIYSCEDCNCRFKINKDKTSIRNCCWDELFMWIFIFALILFLILVVISVSFWDNDNSLPLSMKITIIIDVIIAIISFLAWAAGS